MRARQVAGLMALAIGAGLGGLFAGSFVDHAGPPVWLANALSRSQPGARFVRWWSDASAPAAPPGVPVAGPGAALPDLAFRDLDGASHRLSEWKGRRLLLNFWATWCGPCREELPLLDATRARLAPNGVEVVGIALDDPAAVRAFLAATPVRYPVLLADADAPDPSLRFGNTRGVLPYSVLVDAQGIVREQHVGGVDAALLARWLEPKL
jgi:thiol-disulfide isomerase/thioredoxin